MATNYTKIIIYFLIIGILALLYRAFKNIFQNYKNGRLPILGWQGGALLIPTNPKYFVSKFSHPVLFNILIFFYLISATVLIIVFVVIIYKIMFLAWKNLK